MFVFCDKETDCFRIRNKKTLHFAILWFNDGINFAILCKMAYTKTAILEWMLCLNEKSMINYWNGRKNLTAKLFFFPYNKLRLQG